MTTHLDPEAAAIANDIQLAQHVPPVDGGDIAVDTDRVEHVSVSPHGVNPLIDSGNFVANYTPGQGETIITLRT